MILAIIEKLVFSFNENTVKFIDQLFKLQNSVTRMQKTVEHKHYNVIIHFIRTQNCPKK